MSSLPSLATAAPAPPRTVTLAFTGASGMPYGLRLLECLIASGTRVWLVYSQVAQVVARQEIDLKLPTQPREAQRVFAERFGAADGQLRVFGRDDWFAPPASGSNPADAMAICPCSMGTLAAIAAGLANSLIERAADVALKERRRLVLVARETPFSAIHLENMLKLDRAGAVILPANPGFWHRPVTVQALVDFVVARVLDQLGIAHTLLPRWGDDAIDDRDVAAVPDH
jgi:4-hydroxy-3-polyprenylbenzoate decarboxylase